MKALKTLAFLHSTFEQANEDLTREDTIFDRDFQKMQEAMPKVEDAQRYAEIGMRCRRRTPERGLGMHQRPETAAATHSLSCGTNDKDSNEVKYLQEPLDLLEGFLHRDTHDDVELVSVEHSPAAWGR